jgi:hypothetical protein
VECIDLTPHPGIEAANAGFFSRDNLPQPLHGGHTVRVPKCFELLDADAYFDPAASLNGDMPMHQRRESG